jgi:dUTP pyrophosphatase
MAAAKSGSGATIRFAKVVGHARPPETLNVGDPGLTIFSAENFKLEYGQVHAYRTGVLIEIPDGCLGKLHENAGMGVKGVTVAGGLLTPNDIGEVRVSLMNNHKEAFEIRSGDPLAMLVIEENVAAGNAVEAEEYDLEGLSGELKDRSDENRQETLKMRADKKAKDAQALADATAKRSADATEGGNKKSK